MPWMQIIDCSGNSVPETPDGFAIPPATYIGDTVRPNLLCFHVSANFFLSLFFDKPMDAATLRVDQIHFQDHRVNFTRFDIQLLTGIIVSTGYCIP